MHTQIGAAPFSAASLKQFLLAGMNNASRGFPRLYVAASLQQRRARLRAVSSMFRLRPSLSARSDTLQSRDRSLAARRVPTKCQGGSAPVLDTRRPVPGAASSTPAAGSSGTDRALFSSSSAQPAFPRALRSRVQQRCWTWSMRRASIPARRARPPAHCSREVLMIIAVARRFASRSRLSPGECRTALAV